MKKLLLMTIALVALGATMAAAQGNLNLIWTSACRTTANNAAAAANDQTNSPGGVQCDNALDPFAGGHRFLTASLNNNPDVSTFAGCAVAIEVLADANGTQPSAFWSMGNPEGANSGAMAVRTTVPTTVAGCSNPYLNDSQTIIGDIHQRISSNRVRITYHGSRVRSNTQMDLTPIVGPGGGWVADQMDIDFTNASNAGLGYQPGCQVPVCFNLNSIQYGGGSTTLFTANPDLRNWVTYAGGTGDCPGATPTKNATWGAVKALYR